MQVSIAMRRRFQNPVQKLRFWKAALFAAFLALTISLFGFSTGPLPGHTGGFQEQTCVVCHLDFGLNQGRLQGGLFHIEGVPREYEGGKRYPITVVIGQPNQVRFGFQLATRFQDTGLKAGRLIPVDDFTQTFSMDGITYISHTEEGTRAGSLDGPVEFHFEWEAPAEPGNVLFNAAGNAADHSEDPFGDYIYTAGAFTRSSVPDVTEIPLPERPQVRRAARLSDTSLFYHIPAPVDLRKGQMELHIQHRFIQALADSSPGNAFGIDSGANISLGMSYALSDRVAAGISRTRFSKVVTLSAIYEVQTARESPWKLSLMGGVEAWDNFRRQHSPFLQVASSFDLGIFRGHVVPTAVFNSRNDELLLVRPNPINPERNFTASLGLGLDAALSRRLSLSFEYIPRLAGFGGFGEDNFVLSKGVKVRTWGHVFTVGLSNSRQFTPGFYGQKGDTDLSLGFNIYRRIPR